MCRSNKFAAASQAKCVLWLFKYIFFEREFRMFMSSFESCAANISWNGQLKITSYTR